MAKKEVKKEEIVEIQPIAQEIIVAEEVDHREEFRKFFVQIRGKLGLKQDMEHILWLHLEASGLDKVEKFEEGIRHFGYTL